VSASADTTNTWHFTNAAQYSIVQPTLITVNTNPPGDAELILQPHDIYHTALSNYLTGSANSYIAMGADVSLLLSGGNPYNFPGEFISRVLDGGSGNTWQMIHARVSNRSFNNSMSEVSPALPGLVGLWHMNNNWNDATANGNNGTAHSATFSANAMFGAACGSFDGGTTYVTTPNSLSCTSSLSVSFWVNANASVDSAVLLTPIGLSMGNYASIKIGGWNQGGTGSNSWSAYGISLANDNQNYIATTVTNTFTTANDAGVWRHIVVTYDASSSPSTHIYKDAIDLPLLSQMYGPIASNINVEIGGRSAGGSWIWPGLLDEVAIFNRAITPEEIVNLYNAGSAIRLQVRSGATADLSGKNFGGPDGTTNTFYLGVHQTLVTAGDFDVSNRYAQYKADLSSTASGSQTPYVESVGLFGTRGVQFDSSMLDFFHGTYVQNITNIPAKADTPYVCIAKQINGGYYSNATYQSRVFDAGASTTWQVLQWSLGDEVASTVSGLVALYHLNGTWADFVGAGVHTPSTVVNSTPPYSVFAKLGSQCASFDDGASSSHATGFNLGTNIQSVMFWIRDDNINDGILAMSPTNYISLINRMITPVGFAGNIPTIYVNGNTLSRKLVSGWNHVAIIWPSKVDANALNVGVANGDYMGGLMDELAVYSRQLTSAEISAHYNSARPPVAGSATFNIRWTDDTNSWGAWWGSFSDPTTAAFTWDGRYFQYRVQLNGDGNSTPAFGDVTITDSSGHGFNDTSQSDFLNGTFVGQMSIWYGDEIKLPEIANTDPVNIYGPGEANIAGTWHLDESSWGTVVDSSGKGRSGNATLGATPSPLAQVGTGCGSFDGVAGRVDLGSVSELVNTNLTVSLWFKSTQTNRASLISTYSAGNPYFSLELNSNGTNTAPGKVAFILNDGSGDMFAVSLTSGLNDGLWHNAYAIRQGRYLYLYVDANMSGFTDLGAGFGGLAAASPVLGRKGQDSSEYYQGYLDEVVIWNRALTDREVGQNCAAGYTTTGQGQYTCQVLDSGQPATWQLLSWVADAPYNRPLSVTDASLVGLWRMEDGGPAAVTNSVMTGNNGAASGAPTFGSAGRFTKCIGFNGSSDYVTIANYAAIQPASSISVEAWVNASQWDNRPVFDKSAAGNNGYALGLNASGLPYFWVGKGAGGVTCAGYLPIRVGKWTHLCGTYDGSKLRLYVDGEIEGTTNLVGGVLASGASALIGHDSGGTHYFSGLIDEVAVHNRALDAEEARDHYRAGAVTLELQARSSYGDPTFSGINFVGPGGLTNTYFTLSSGESLIGSLGLGQYFQYRAYLATEDFRITPRLAGTRVFVASYPSSNPTVEPTAAAGAGFFGRLLSFSHLRTTNPNTGVKYQVSGDAGPSPNWYYWNGTNWIKDTVHAGYNGHANLDTEINSNIGSFYDQLYPKLGGNFRFKAFLHSDGDQQQSVDYVRMVGSDGRIVVLSPNGTETGTASWVSTVTYPVTWSSTGKVSNSLVVDLYDSSGNNFIVNLATNVLNTGVTNVLINNNPGDYRIRVWDSADPTIGDFSDSFFSLVESFHLTAPNGGEYWTIGSTRQVTWDSPLSVSANVDLWITYDGDNWASNNAAWTKVATNIANIRPGHNVYNWAIPSNDWRLVSEKAKMAVVPFNIPFPLSSWPGGANRDFSDNNFTNAGIVVMFPSNSVGIRSSNSVTITWAAAGVGPTAVVSLFNGVTWSILGTNTCTPGTNNAMTATLVGRTSNALIRVTSGGLTGISYPFTLADINISAPIGGVKAVQSHWLINSTNNITWTSSGAGSNVTVKYITSEMPDWVVISNNFPNNDSGLVTNSLPWVIPGPPSGTATVRVESVAQPSLYAEVSPFSLAGIQITEPSGPVTWDFRGTNTLGWLSRDGASVITIDISFNGGLTFEATTNGTAYSDDGTNSATIAFGAIRRPTDQARFRLTQACTLTNVVQPFVDISDVNFGLRGVSMSYPSNGVTLNLARTAINGLQWFSALTSAGHVQLYYMPDGVSGPSSLIMNGANPDFFNTDMGSCSNSSDWVVDRSFKPSTQAVVEVIAGAYHAWSTPFMMRGVRITGPAAGENVTIGSSRLVTWDYAGVLGSATASNYVSLTGIGGPFAPHGFVDISEIDFGSVPWTVDPDADPTTNAVIQMQVYSPTQETDLVILSQPFTLRGIKIYDPAPGTNWLLGTSQTIRFMSAGMGAGMTAAIYYSPDGTTFDMANPVTNNFPVIDAMNTLTWNIENTSALTRMPSTNAHLMIVSGSFTNISKAFTVSGIKITSPGAGDVWAVSDGTNFLRWVSVGFPGGNDLSFTVTAGPNGTPGYYPHTETIAIGAGGTSYPWVMIDTSVGKPVTIGLTNGTFSTVSAPFEIVQMPSVRILTPAAGDYWKVAGTNTIQWVRGGEMSNDFRVTVICADGFSQQLGLDGAFPLNAGVFSYTWAGIPDHLGPAKLVVTNLNNAAVWDVFTNFTIAPRFDIEPFTEEAYALSSLKFFFYTRGSPPSGVDFYYSTDPLRGTNSWTLINTSGPMTASVANNQEASTNWSLPNVRTTTAWLRIQDHSYSQMFSAAKPGPYDDYGMFAIKYYQVVWRVLDGATTQNLDHLSVTEPFGSSSDISSPWTNYYPYGTFDSIWYRQYFFDLPVLAWQPQLTRTNTIVMTRSDIEPSYQVMCSYAYDTSNRVFHIHAWLERGGEMIYAPPYACDVSIFKPNGGVVEQIEDVSSSNPDTNGVFWLDWIVANTEANKLPPGQHYTSTDIFFARVQITYAGTVYSAGLTFQLYLGANQDTAAMIQSIVSMTESNINANIGGLSNNIANLSSNMTSVASGMNAGFSNLTALGESTTNILGNMTNVLGGISSNMVAMTNSLLPSIDALTNTITTFGASFSNLTAGVSNINAMSESQLARILTRPSTVFYGSTNIILYKTMKGYVGVVNITVSSASQGICYSGPMSEVFSGIYQDTVVANWGTNEYTVLCSDPKASDSMILTVTGDNSKVVPDMLSALSNRLDTLETELTNVVGAVQGIPTTLSVLAAISNDVSALQWQIANVSNSVTSLTNGMVYLTNNIASMTNGIAFMTNSMVSVVNDIASMSNSMVSVTNSIAFMTNSMVSVTNSIASMTNGMAFMTNSMVSLTNSITFMTNGMAFVTNTMVSVTNSMVSVTNSIASLTNGIAFMTNSMVSVTNMMVSVTNSVTSMNNIMVSVTNSMVAVTNSIASMSNGIAFMTNSMVSVTNMMVSVTNSVASMSNIMVSVTNSMVSITNGIASMSNSIAFVSNGVVYVTNGITFVSNSVVVLTNITGSLTNIQTTLKGLDPSALASIRDKLGQLTDLPSADTLFGRLSELQGALDSVSGSASSASSSASSASKKAQQAKSAAASAAGSIAAVQDALDKGDLEGALAMLTDIKNAVGAAQSNISQIPSVVKFTDLYNDLQDTTKTIKKLADSKGWPWLLNAGVIESGGTNGPGIDINTIGTFNQKLEETRGALMFMKDVADQARYRPVVEDYLHSSE
jgi:hypothetical protein